MPSIGEFRALRHAYESGDELRLAAALDNLSLPSEEALVEAIHACMTKGDRNLRVLLLRILRYQHGGMAARTVLAGLNDPTRRVCAVAIQACPNFLSQPEIVERLEKIVKQATLKRKLRRRALSMLAGDEGRMPGDLTGLVVAALTRLMDSPELRFTIVFGLARLELAPRTKLLLEDFAKSQNSVESAMARRALHGERIIHIDACSGDPAMSRQIQQTCEIAHGRMYYWLPRAGLSQ